MVYCGKLSKACLPCRTRKLLCDLRKEGCGQCSRAHLVCTGYRDTRAIRIRDETATIQQKVARRISAPPTTVQSLDLALCHQAKEIFFQQYAVDQTKSYYFLRQYYSPSAGDVHLIKSIDAVALACLNYQKPSQSAQSEARLNYIDALKLTGKALQSRELAADDSTMLSILLLDLYEKITGKEPAYDGAWTTHLKGALLLVQLRGEEQYRNTESLGMLARLSTNMLISCVASDRVVPEEVVTLLAAVSSSSVETSNLKRRESELMVNYARLKSQAKHNLLPDEEIIRTAMNLDKEFLTLSRLLNLSGKQKTVNVDERSAHHYELYHYIYSEQHIGQMWNVLRITRVFLCELILSRCHKLPNGAVSGSGQFYEKYYATTTIDQMSREVCATVPQYIGAVSNAACQNTASADILPVSPVQDSRILLARRANPKQYLPSYRLIFPLYVAAQSPTASKSIKRFVIEQLHFMADHHGIENALLVSKILESGEMTDPWIVYALLGSYAFVC